MNAKDAALIACINLLQELMENASTDQAETAVLVINQAQNALDPTLN